VSVALVIQHTMRMRHIVICALPRSIKFSAEFSEKKKQTNATEHKIFLLISSIKFV